MKPTQVEVAPEALSLMQSMTGSFADRYLNDHVIHPLIAGLRTDSANLGEIQTKLSDPFWCLHGLFSHYVFSRRGKERTELSQIACTALRRFSKPDEFVEKLESADPVAIWEAFVEVCKERKTKENEQQNRAIIQGMFELAQEIHAEQRGVSIAGKIVNSVQSTHRIEQDFERIVDIRGMGPKSSSLILRDMIWVFDLEDRVDFADRLYLQPVDRWLRAMVGHFTPELTDQPDAADWVIAGKMAKYARHLGLSGIRLNMGMTQYGTSEITSIEQIPFVLRKRFAAIRENLVP
jgi:hypothetical protein